MNSKYTDIINTEYLIESDQDTPWEQLHKRDRSIYLNALTSGIIKEDNSPQKILHVWQHFRLDNQEGSRNLGHTICSAAKYASIILLGLFFFLGFTAMVSFLYYTGEQAVNVVHFFLAFVVLQWIFLGTTLFLQRRAPQPPWFFIIKYTINMVFKKVLGTGHLQQREQALSLLGSLWHKADIISLLKPYTFVLQQKIAIALNLGLLSALSLRVIGTDLAFGWQSTLHITDESMYSVVQLLSTPWQWLGIQSPTLAQIAGSKVILKDGIFHLLQSDLSSWWPFLTMCLIFYALLPRCIVLLYALTNEKKSCSNFVQHNRGYKNILQRMQSPVVESHIEVKEQSTTPSKSVRKRTPSLDASELIKEKALVLLPFDISHVDTSILERWLYEKGYGEIDLHVFMKSFGDDAKLLSELSINSDDIIIFMEAHMPPLAESLSFLQKVQKQTETYVYIFVVSLNGTTLSKTVSQNDFQMWKQKVHSLGNSHIRIIPPYFEENS